MAQLKRNGKPITATGNDALSSQPAAIGVVRAPATTDISIRPLSEWREESGDGLLLEVFDEPEARFENAPVIAINFEAFSDGRGLSLAVLLRTRFAYQGELRAVGDVQPDLIHYMKRCGFDSFHMADSPADQTAQTPSANDSRTLAPYSNYYQASVLDSEPALRRVRRCA
jgi:uncharacterized protein (DUF934 family)